MSLKTFNIPPLDPNNFTGPARNMSGVARVGDVSPDTAYGEFARWLYLDVAGTLSVINWDGSTSIYSSLASGVWHPIYSIGINSNGTTATGIKWGS